MRSFPETYKITAQNMNMDGINNTAKYKRRNGWTNLKKIETDCNRTIAR